MVSTPIQTLQLTVEDFVRLYDTEGPFEIINGEIIKLIPTVSGHGDIIKKLVMALYLLEQKGIGEVMFDLPFVLIDLPQWVHGSRVPDVMFYLMARITTYREQNPDWKKKPYILVPDLVVEVISENDSYSDVDQKVIGYLEDGVQLIWVVDPKRSIVMVYQSGNNEVIRLTTDNTLTGGALLPGFEISVASLFA